MSIAGSWLLLLCVAEIVWVQGFHTPRTFSSGALWRGSDGLTNEKPSPSVGTSRNLISVPWRRPVWQLQAPSPLLSPLRVGSVFADSFWETNHDNDFGIEEEDEDVGEDDDNASEGLDNLYEQQHQGEQEGHEPQQQQQQQ